MARGTTIVHTDGSMSPEELQKAIEEYKARKAERTAASGEAEAAKDAETEVAEETPAPAAEEENKDSEGKQSAEEVGSTPADIAQLVKGRRDRRDAEDDPKDAEAAMGVIAQQDEDIDMLLAAIEKLIAEEQMDCGACDNADNEDNKDGEGEEENKDSSDDESKSLNADSADEVFRQRLTICRIGDKLHMDGLENMSIKQGKKAIIAKVLPNMRMDGKSDAYIDAMFDLAVGEANKHKGVAYQKQQMTAQAPKKRADSNESMAATARKKMIEREGGNE